MWIGVFKKRKKKFLLVIITQVVLEKKDVYCLIANKGLRFQMQEREAKWT